MCRPRATPEPDNAQLTCACRYARPRRAAQLRLTGRTLLSRSDQVQRLDMAPQAALQRVPSLRRSVNTHARCAAACTPVRHQKQRSGPSTLRVASRAVNSPSIGGIFLSAPERSLKCKACSRHWLLEPWRANSSQQCVLWWTHVNRLTALRCQLLMQHDPTWTNKDLCACRGVASAAL